LLFVVSAGVGSTALLLPPLPLEPALLPPPLLSDVYVLPSLLLLLLDALSDLDALAEPDLLQPESTLTAMSTMAAAPICHARCLLCMLLVPQRGAIAQYTRGPATVPLRVEININQSKVAGEIQLGLVVLELCIDELHLRLCQRRRCFN
jgi:hypothetical protein